jgi:pimeloyl-ACP methyl ester carboxylesterase
MWGLSGGGPHVLTCAALLPDLVTAAASLASPAPCDAEGLDWLSGFSQDAIEEVRLMFGDHAGARALFEQEREKMLAASPAQMALDLEARAPGAGLALLTDEAVSIQLALVPGIEGTWDDCVAQVTPWGFEVAQVSVPVLLLHGRPGTRPYPSGTVNGWPRASPASKPGSSPTRGTPSGKITSQMCTPGS